MNDLVPHENFSLSFGNIDTKIATMLYNTLVQQCSAQYSRVKGNFIVKLTTLQPLHLVASWS